jgi:hypothetical protein
VSGEALSLPDSRALLYNRCVMSRPPAPVRLAALLLLVGGVSGAVGAPPAPSIRQVAEFYVEKDVLSVRTVLPPTNGLTVVEVGDLPGTLRVDVTLRSRRDSPRGSLYFKLMHTGPGAAGGPSAETNLFVRPGYLQLNRVARDGDELRTTTFTQSGDFGAADAPLNDRDDRVALRVRHVRVTTGELLEDVARTAPTFPELLRRFPHDAARHLGPLFRDFAQEATVFGADTKVAWQVLWAKLPRDPALVPQVKALVAQLDAADFQQREKAVARLRELGGPAALVASDLPRKSFSAEQNSHIEALLADYRPLPEATAAERLKDLDFMLGCLAYGEDAMVRAAAAAQVSELTGRKLSSPPDDLAQRLKVVQQIRKDLGSSR